MKKFQPSPESPYHSQYEVNVIHIVCMLYPIELMKSLNAMIDIQIELDINLSPVDYEYLDAFNIHIFDPDSKTDQNRLFEFLLKY